MHLGVILPNYGAGSSPDGIRRVAEAAEELGFDSVWATEHIAVGPEAREPFGRVYEPLATLAWMAGWTERVRLGTSVLILPLHDPFRLAKEAATLQELSGGRFILGIGMGWHRDEFDFLGVPFEGRGRRADEQLRLIRALWAGEPSFEGRFWSYRDVTAEPLPSPVPEIWVGGNGPLAVRRTVALADVWHPTRATADEIRTARDRHPGLRVVPRTSPEHVDALLEAGAEGVVVTTDDEAAMRRLVDHYR